MKQLSDINPSISQPAMGIETVTYQLATHGLILELTVPTRYEMQDRKANTGIRWRIFKQLPQPTVTRINVRCPVVLYRYIFLQKKGQGTTIPTGKIYLDNLFLEAVPGSCSFCEILYWMSTSSMSAIPRSCRTWDIFSLNPMHTNKFYFFHTTGSPVFTVSLGQCEFNEII